MTSFNELLDAAAAAGDRIELPAEWNQGRATYGGLVAALLLQRARREVAPDRQLRSASVAFVGPATAGPAELRARVLRAGGSATFIESELVQNGDETRSAVQAVFGAPRRSIARVDADAMPDVPPPDSVGDMPHLPGLIPDFLVHLRLRWVLGHPPHSGRDSREIAGWCRLADGRERDSIEHAVGLMDAWPAPVLSMFRERAPASSMTWTIDVMRELSGAPCDGWWAYHARTDAAHDGYAFCTARLWHPSGELTLVGRQCVAVFG